MDLIIAEKPAAAKDIAAALGITDRKNGYYAGDHYLVGWCIGHLIQAALPEAYGVGKWALDTLPILPQKWIYQITDQTKNQFYILKDLLQRTDIKEVICATDAGREGELIFRLVYQQAGCQKPVKRLWVSSLEASSILAGMKLLRPAKDYDNVYQSALCRQRADWLVGMNFSRAYSCRHNQRLVVGRCQTPTVKLIVDRQREIDSFNPKPYQILTAVGGGLTVHRRVEDPAEATGILAKCQGRPGKITEVKEEDSQQQPPFLYDLTTLQREANRHFKMSASETHTAAQSLYEKKLITYPRTDCQFVTSDMAEILKKLLSGLAPWLSIPYRVESTSIARLINDQKVAESDLGHHAIIPTVQSLSNQGEIQNLSKEDQQIWLLVSRRLLMAAYLPYRFHKTDLILEIEDVEFKAQGVKVIDPGFKALEGEIRSHIKPSKDSAKDKSEDEDNGLIPPTIKQGDMISNMALSSKSKKTQPPRPYTDGTLLAAMENAMSRLEDDELKKESAGLGIGSQSGRDEIIERIIETGLVERKNGVFSPTAAGCTLIDLLPDLVKSPEMTARWEQQLSRISTGKSSADDFMNEIETFIQSVVAEVKEAAPAAASGFQQKKESLGQCPRCGKDIYEGKDSFYCSGYKENGCAWKLWKNDLFWSNKKKTLTAAMVSKLLTGKPLLVKALFSEKSNKTYDAMVSFEDKGDRVGYKLSFDTPQKKEKKPNATGRKLIL